jgi:NADH-quinone oxidoreductase subunit N
MYYGSESVFFYLVAYAVMTLGAFGVISALRVKGQVVQTIDDLSGLGWTHPLPALALSICLLSLAGIPPLVGFWAKFEIFTALLAASQRTETGSFIALAIIGMLSAAAGAYYYLRLVVVMYLRPSKEEVRLSGGWPVALAAGGCAILTVLFGLFSSPVSSAARAAAQAALHNSPPQISHVAATVPGSQPAGRPL